MGSTAQNVLHNIFWVIFPPSPDLGATCGGCTQCCRFNFRPQSPLQTFLPIPVKGCCYLHRPCSTRPRCAQHFSYHPADREDLKQLQPAASLPANSLADSLGAAEVVPQYTPLEARECLGEAVPFPTPPSIPHIYTFWGTRGRGHMSGTEIKAVVGSKLSHKCRCSELVCTAPLPTAKCCWTKSNIFSS